ncbi:MAG: YdjY domain-containing protein [Pirellulales bacterium]
MPRSSRYLVAVVALVLSAGGIPAALGQKSDIKRLAANEVKPPPADKTALQHLSPDSAVWLDKQNKRLIVEGEVCLTRGLLEMFACPKDSKEHESIVAVQGKAYVVHAGLLALGAKEGRPVQFDPEYVPASGARVDVICFWTDDKGKQQQTPAQQWIRNVKTKKPMEYHWVFAGSDFWLDENTGKRHYLGDAGDFICVSNFPSATLDLPVKSPQDNENLLYEAFTEKIPPRGTKVTLVLVPHLEKEAAKSSSNDEKKKQAN